MYPISFITALKEPNDHTPSTVIFKCRKCAIDFIITIDMSDTFIITSMPKELEAL